jgi:peptide/nickel transport system ATP-binding protein
VVADEPTSMVDATLGAGIVALIRQLRDRYGIAFLVITHDLDMAAAVAEEVAVMSRGRLVECGPTPEVFASPSTTTRRRSCGPPARWAGWTSPTDSQSRTPVQAEFLTGHSHGVREGPLVAASRGPRCRSTSARRALRPQGS